MPNPLFKAMGGSPKKNLMMQQFEDFMQMMRGRDPRQMINECVQSGKISQQQLDTVQEQAKQVTGMLDGMRGMFGF